MRAPLVLTMIVLASPTIRAHADVDSPASAPQTSFEASDGGLRSNLLTIQAGLLPSLSILGVEYSRLVSRHFEVGASASYGFTADMTLEPRFRWPLSRSSLAVGVGPSLAWEKGIGLNEASRWYTQLLADAEFTHETVDHWLLQARLGVTLFRDRSMDVAVVPFVGIGAGIAL